MTRRFGDIVAFIQGERKVVAANWTDEIVLCVVWVAACLPFLNGDRYIDGDSIAAFYPQVAFVTDSLRHGRSPWWNPFEYGGLPVLADPQGMVFTPHTLVGLIAGGSFNLHVFDLTTLACPLLGALALRRYTITYAETRLMPLLGAAVFMLGGVATSRLQHVPQIYSYSLLPIQLLAFRAACRHPAASTVGVLAVTLVAGLLNLNQVTFLSLWALLPFVLFHLYRNNDPVRALISVSCAVLAALVLALPVLSAVAEFLPISNRATLSLADSSGFSFPLLNITSLLLPGLFGTLTPATGLWPPTDLSQDYLYIGLIPCLILIAAVWRAPGALMPAPLCVLMTVLWFVFAMGTKTPVYTFLFKHLPGFNAFRRPADGAFLMNFSIALTIGSFRLGRLGMAGRRLRLLHVVLGACLAVLVFAASAALYEYAGATGHRGELLPIIERVGRHALMIAMAGGAALLVRQTSARNPLAPIILIAATGEMLAAGRFGPILSFAYTEGAVAQIYGRSANPVDYATGIERTIAYLRAHGAADRRNPTRIEVLGGALGGTMPLTERIAVTQGYNPLALGSYVRLIGHQNLP